MKTLVTAFLVVWWVDGVCAQPMQLPHSFRVVSWNVSWLGHPTFPPADDERQIENVLRVLRANGADAYALQEVSSISAFRRIVQALGPEYSGIVAPRGGDQRLALIFRSDSSRLLSASDAPLEGADYFFAGRPPLFVRMSVAVGTDTYEILLVVVHLKAFADPESYERRLRSVALLKANLDAQEPGTRIILTGDFNDLVERSTAIDRDSPLRAMRLDTVRYLFATAAFEQTSVNTYCASPTCSEGAAFDHFVLSRTLTSWSPDVRPLSAVLDEVADFVTSTSDHLPVSLTMTIPDTSVPRASRQVAIEAAFPNPFDHGLTLELASGAGPAVVRLVDILGRVRASETVPPSERTQTLQFSGATLDSGPYLIRVSTSRASDSRIVMRVR